ncbi:hypothetical protein PICMEDRAFT_70315 [Pichia membranifaciens NRRL Y-2026]|uniref:Defect at low temperature protein 1 n=1 Tax=Pichia membranifaciens NRRL Y-2026 TaxID=763406 RepID=A0A1E3NSQ0_9ASCO|nr:hypothetical protein PICMEDRAFT_70315 [Pichia membranifaciens NRRL Y-2026]ODQ48698.1 hypothetical protein PICMEDRAFT_70315 [Pichia membranifaciens NRRL Y-2026]
MVGRYLKNTTHSGLLWLYTSSFVVIMIIILSMSSVLPIDVIVQSKTNNSHLATNTVIILVICVVFLFISAILHMFRLFYDNMLLQEIPKPYVPITPNDVGKSTSRTIEREIVRCKEILERAKPRGDISHPGLFHQSEYNHDVELPDNLIYENVVNVIGQELKYNGTLTVGDDKVLRLDNHYTLRELLHVYEDDEMVGKFLNLYEKLRFSGEPITCDEFKDFLQKWSYVKSKL